MSSFKAIQFLTSPPLLLESRGDSLAYWIQSRHTLGRVESRYRGCVVEAQFMLKSESTWGSRGGCWVLPEHILKGKNGTGARVSGLLHWMLDVGVPCSRTAVLPLARRRTWRMGRTAVSVPIKVPSIECAPPWMDPKLRRYSVGLACEPNDWIRLPVKELSEDKSRVHKADWWVTQPMMKNLAALSLPLTEYHVTPQHIVRWIRCGEIFQLEINTYCDLVVGDALICKLA
ncbi:hypothetical protein B0H14DRAFT_3567232 [Mycena olivaceomarginata]|nr:hypothetical protein B0H14DRAFT_3567232 [Mycena olivaceomarginata]